MPKGPQGQKRPGDVIGAAIMVAKVATVEVEDNTASIAGWVETAVDRETADILRSHYAAGDRDALALLDRYIERVAA